MEKRGSVWQELKEKLIENRTNYVIWTVVYLILAIIQEMALALIINPEIMEIGSPVIRIVFVYINIVFIYLTVIFFKAVKRRGEEM